MIHCLYGQLVELLDLVVRGSHTLIGLDDARVRRIDGEDVTDVSVDDVVGHVTISSLISIPGNDLVVEASRD